MTSYQLFRLATIVIAFDSCIKGVCHFVTLGAFHNHTAVTTVLTYYSESAFSSLIAMVIIMHFIFDVHDISYD